MNTFCSAASLSQSSLSVSPSPSPLLFPPFLSIPLSLRLPIEPDLSEGRLGRVVKVHLQAQVVLSSINGPTNLGEAADTSEGPRATGDLSLDATILRFEGKNRSVAHDEEAHGAVDSWVPSQESGYSLRTRVLGSENLAGAAKYRLQDLLCHIRGRC